MFESRPIPLGSFGSVLGIVGLGLAWRAAANAQGAPPLVGELIVGAGAVLFILLLIAWLLRIGSRPQEIRDESANPLISCFYATITISLSLLSASAVRYSKTLALILWAIAAVGSVGLFIYLLGHWI
jgi:tellurite resistance protein